MQITPHRMSGVTLVELMVTVAVLAIVTAIALPSFQSTIRSNRAATAANELLASLMLARSEAIRNGNSAGICPSANGTSCNSDWSSGWLVWSDADGNGNLDGNETIIRYSQARNGIQLSTGSANRFIFDRRGRAKGKDGSNADLSGSQVITVKPENCPAGEQSERDLTITSTGQSRLSRSACA